MQLIFKRTTRFKAYVAFLLFSSLCLLSRFFLVRNAACSSCTIEQQYHQACPRNKNSSYQRKKSQRNLKHFSTICGLISYTGNPISSIRRGAWKIICMLESSFQSHNLPRVPLCSSLLHLFLNPGGWDAFSYVNHSVS